MWKGAILVALAVSASAEPFVSGRVTDARGAPVASADVMVVRLDADWQPVGGAHASLPLDAPLLRAVTDESGAFRIDAATIAAGLHAIAFATPGSAPILRFRERIAFGAPALPGDLELRAPASATVRGVALDESGAPVAGARVVASSAGAWGASVVNATTDAAGRFELAAPQDSTLTLATMTADRFGIVRAPVGEPKDVTLALHLGPLQLVEGVATSLSTGRPVAGLRVRVLAPTWDPFAPNAAEADQRTRPWGRSPVLAESATGDDGRYSVRLPPEGIAFMTSPRTVAMHCVPGRTPSLDGEPLRGTVVDALGAAVAGATVRWIELPDIARTDAQGRFELTPDVNAAVLVTTDDGAVRLIEEPAPGQRVVLPSRATLRGTVRAGAEPVAGATVRATVAAFDVLTATDATGAFALSLRGATRLRSEAGEIVVTADAGDPPATVAAPARAARAGRTLRVHVTGDGGRAVEGAVLRAVPTRFETFTDELLPTAASGRDGVATLVLGDSAPVDVLAMRPGMARTWQRAVRADTLTLRMDLGAILRGVVRDADGRPVGGAAVVAEREDAAPAAPSMFAMAAPEHWVAMTLADGAFVLRDLPAGTHAIAVVARSHASPPRQRVALAPGATATLDVVLGRGAALRGLVRDEAGPVVGARVAAVARTRTFSGAGFGVDGAPRVTYTIEDGTFLIDGLDPDQWYDVAITADWHADESAGGRPSESVLDVAMRATGAIEGVVQGDATEAYVRCTPPGADEREARDAMVSGAVADGKFSIDSVPPGIYSCAVESSLASGTADGVDVRARAATAVTVRLRDKPSIVVTALDVEGRPVAGARVWTSDSAATTGADGRARVALPADAASPRIRGSGEAGEDDEAGEEGERVYASAPGHASADAPIPSPAPKSVTLELKRLPTLRGRVVDAAGLPAPGAEIFRYDVPTDVVSGADGRFELAAPEGFGEGGGEPLVARRTLVDVIEEGSVEVPAPAPQGEIVITLARIELGELAVMVRDAAGPVAGARVSVMDDHASSGSTDAEGRHVAARLKPGSHVVLVETETGAMAMRRDVVVRAGERTVENVVLGEGWTIEGTVVEGVRPVEGASIVWMSPLDGGFGREAMSHADGSFRAGPVPSEADEVQLMVKAGAARPRSLTVRRGGPSLVVNVAAITVEGRLLAADAPVAEARVKVRCGPGGRAFGMTDAAGAFRVEGVAASSACALLVEREDAATHEIRVDTPAEGVVRLGDVRLEDRVVRGRVLVPGGDPPRAIEIRLSSAEGNHLGSVAVAPAPDGTFAVTLPSGGLAYVAVVEDPDLAWASGTIGGDRPMDLVLTRPATLEIVARRADGSAADAWAGVLTHDGVACDTMGVGMGSRGEDGEGPLLIEGLPAGRFAIGVTSGRAQEQVEVDLAVGERRQVTVTLP